MLHTNNRDPAKLLRLMKQKLTQFNASAAKTGQVKSIESGKSDARYSPKPPEGGLVLRVRAKVLGGYKPTDDPVMQIFHNALSRDNMWISKSEHEALAKEALDTGIIPESLDEILQDTHAYYRERVEARHRALFHIAVNELLLDKK